MEDTPSPQDDRKPTDSRDPRAAFSAPEQPAKRGSRRAAPPAVTFQPPSVTGSAETPGRPSPKPSGGTVGESTDATAGLESLGGSPGPQSKARPTKATRPRKAQPPAAAPENVDPAPAQPTADGTPPAKATPRKRAPRKAAPKPAAQAPAEAAPAAEQAPAEPAAAAQTPAEPPAPAQTPAEPPAPAQTPAEPPAPAQTPAEPPAPAQTPVEPAAAAQAAQTPVEPATAAQTPGEPGQEPAALAPADPIDPPSAEPTARHRYTEAWAKLVADPGHTPELLALAAVQTVGPRARDWARRTREAYPGATDAGLARLATAQFTRFGSLGSVFGAVAGSYASVALLGAAAVTQAELILHLAAAYGLDPTDEKRAVDLLVLTRVHPDRPTAEEAITRAKQPAYEEGGVTGAAWRLGRLIVTKTGGWTAVRLANRFFPGASLVAATLSVRAATETVAHRANAYYSQAGAA